MARSIWRYALLFLSFLSLSLAASPTSFCKCTCNTNSTIIPLDGPSKSTPNTPAKDPPSSHNPLDRLFRRAEDPSTPPKHRRTCADCTKSFCLEYQLPICKDVELDSVFTTCFQRDSTKDELVVFIFLGATVGLLGWAGVRPWWERWRERRGYASVGS